MTPMTLRLRPMHPSWQQLPRRARVRRIVLLACVLVYLGYSYGWWGRQSVVLQTAFQCISPPGSEQVRYRPFTLLTSGCSGLELQSIAPSGFALLFVKQNDPQRETQYLDLRTGARRTIDLSDVPRGRFTRVGLLSDTLVLAQTYFGVDAQRAYHIINIQTNQTIPLTYLEALNGPSSIADALLEDSTWQTLRPANYVVVGSFTFNARFEIVALLVQDDGMIATGLVISTTDQAAHEQALRDLASRNIPYQVPWPEYLRISHWPVLSTDQQLLADTEGIFRAFTATRIRESGQISGWRAWRPERWVCGDQAVVYTRPLVYLLDFGTTGAFTFQKWRVPQPTLLLSMPGGGCPAFAP